MTLLKGLQRTIFWSAAALLAFGAMPAKAVPVNTPFGTCTGSATEDCVTAVGHISASVVTTLTINEQRAISFGNFTVACTGGTCSGDAFIDMDTAGVRTATDSGTDDITLLHGVDATGGPGAVASGSQSPGHYTVETQTEGGTTQVYISFAQNDGTIVDACTPAGLCDIYHAGSAVTLTGPTAQTFTVDRFVFNESGSDVYGHYIDNTGGASNPAPGSQTPFDHTHTANAGAVDVVVGGRLHTNVTAADYAPGKYTGTFNVMVSY